MQSNNVYPRPVAWRSTFTKSLFRWLIPAPQPSWVQIRHLLSEPAWRKRGRAGDAAHLDGDSADGAGAAVYRH